MTRFSLFASLAASILISACASESSVPSASSGSGSALASGPARVGDTGMGKVLTDAKGMTLYTFDRDTPGKSTCNGQCAQNWPPLAASADARSTGDWTVVTRDDGTKMWAYKGKPVYGWAKDQKAGDTTGEGVNNVWRVARP